MSSIVAFGSSIRSLLSPVVRAVPPAVSAATTTGALRARLSQLREASEESSSESPNPIKRTLLFLSSLFTCCYVALPITHTSASIATDGRVSLQAVSPAAYTVICSLVLPILGGIACAIDLTVEAQQTYHCIRFLRSNSSWHLAAPTKLSLLERTLPSFATIEEKALQEHLIRLQSKYFEITSQEAKSLSNSVNVKCARDGTEKSVYFNEMRNHLLVNKKYRLIRCVGQVFAHQLESMIPALTKELSSYSAHKRQEACAHALVLLNDMRIQAKKSQIIYLLGMISAAVTLVAVALTCITPIGPIIPVIISLVGTLFYLMRYIASVELMRTRGWQFCVKDALVHSLIDPIVNVLKKIQTQCHCLSQRL